MRSPLECSSDALPLDRHDHRYGGQEDQEAGARDHRSGMPAHEPLRVVDPVALTRLDRLVLQVMSDVRDQPFDRAVAMLRLLAQRPHDDRIEIADEATAQPLRRDAARERQCASIRLVLRSASRLHRAQHVRARSRRIRDADRALHLELARCTGKIVRAQPVSSRYRTMPSEYTSLAVVTAPPMICSGLAYSGVSRRSFMRVSSDTVLLPLPWFSSFAMPKSSSFARAVAVTRMFAGLRSRWMIRF